MTQQKSPTQNFQQLLGTSMTLCAYVMLFPIAMIMAWSDAQDDKRKPVEPPKP